MHVQTKTMSGFSSFLGHNLHEYSPTLQSEASARVLAHQLDSERCVVLLLECCIPYNSSFSVTDHVPL